MRRVMLLALSVLTVVSMAISPALAHDRDGDCWDEDWSFWVCDKDRHDKDRHDNGRNDVFFVPFFVQKGFWDWDPFWGWFWIWFWVECGGDWDC
jgi:hypothetical protein